MASATPFETDLRAVRDARGTTLDQIQQQTRIPVDVLSRFEDGRLLRDETYNEVYLRAFLKSYAKAVGLSQGDVVAAYDLHRAGRYDGRLHPEHVPGAEPPPTEPAAEPSAGPDATDSLAAPAAIPAGLPSTDDRRPPPTPRVEPPTPRTPAAAVTPAVAPAVEALRQNPEATARLTPSAAPVAGTRVARPGVPGARRSFDKNWGTILALFGGFVVLLGTALYFLIFRGGDAPDNDAPLAADGNAAAIGSARVGAGAAGSGPRLQMPLRVTVSAGGDGLQSFRATADRGDRRPYWVNGGEAQVFEADSALVLWGEGDTMSFEEATLELQGQRWTPPSGRPVRLDAQRGQALLDSLAGTAPTAPVAPAP